MAPSHYPWFHQRFAAATRGWSLDEEGAYRRLLDIAWEQDGLPFDIDEIRSLLGLEALGAAFERIWNRVAPKFPPSPHDDRRRNPFQERVRADQARWRSSQQDGIDELLRGRLDQMWEVAPKKLGYREALDALRLRVVRPDGTVDLATLDDLEEAWRHQTNLRLEQQLWRGHFPRLSDWLLGWREQEDDVSIVAQIQAARERERRTRHAEGLV